MKLVAQVVCEIWCYSGALWVIFKQQFASMSKEGYRKHSKYGVTDASMDTLAFKIGLAFNLQ